MMAKNLVVMSLRGVGVFGALVLVAGCGEPMQFENAGSKLGLVEDQWACDLELQSPAGTQYVNEAKGLIDPWQVCVERKGWKRVDRPASSAASAKL